MQGRYWFQSHIHHLYTEAYSLYSNLYSNVTGTISVAKKEISTTLSQTYQLFNRVYRSQSVREWLHQSVIQGGQGFIKGFDLNWVTALMNSKEIQKVLLLSLEANFLYLSCVLLYELSYREDLKEYGDTVMLMMVNEYMNDIIFNKLFLHVAIDNPLYFISMAQATVNANPINENDETACHCRTIPIIRASLASTFYYIGNSLAIKGISHLPYFSYLTPFLQALLYGQSLLEYKLSAIGFCTNHRYRILNKNNAFAFGLGLSFMMFLQLSRYGVLRLFDVDIHSNPFMYDAIFSILYQHYIMITLLIDRKFPGKQEGLDIFYASRLLTEAALKKMWQLCGPILIEKSKDNEDAFLNSDDFFNYPPIKLLKNIFFSEEDFSSLDKFIKRSSIDLYFELNGKKIKSTLENVIILRNKSYALSISYLADYLPNFLVSNSEKKMLSIIFDKKLEKLLLNANEFIGKVLLAQAAREEQKLIVKKEIEKSLAQHNEKQKESKTPPENIKEENSEEMVEAFIKEALAEDKKEEKKAPEEDKKEEIKPVLNPEWHIIKNYEPNRNKEKHLLNSEERQIALQKHGLFSSQKLKKSQSQNNLLNESNKGFHHH